MATLRGLRMVKGGEWGGEWKGGKGMVYATKPLLRKFYLKLRKTEGDECIGMSWAPCRSRICLN